MEMFFYLVFTFALGAVIGKFVLKTESVSFSEYDKISREKNEFEKKLISLESDLRNKEILLEEKEKSFEKSKEDLKIEFKNMANEIFESKKEIFKNENKGEINNILIPLQQKIGEFQRQVKDAYDNENKDKSSLKEQIKQMFELNQTLSRETKNLTSALKGEQKMQGNWGETLLETLLEKSGLERGMHFSAQQKIEGRIPDVIVHLPEGKNIIIDAKVSLTNYTQYIELEQDSEKKIALQHHIRSIKNHIDDLSKKEYHNLENIKPPDYVLMFCAVEPSLMLALKEDASLFEYGLKKNIILVSATTLMAVMKTVSFIWKTEDQKKNVLEIARQGASLYDKFVAFTDDLIKVGNQMEASKKTYIEAMGKLTEGRDNLITKVERLKKIGIKSEKTINQSLLNKSLE